MAVGTFRTNSGELVKSDSALIDYNPLMPGQTSPFKSMGTDNPQITDCGLNFKYLMGGSISFTEKGEQKSGKLDIGRIPRFQ